MLKVNGVDIRDMNFRDMFIAILLSIICFFIITPVLFAIGLSLVIASPIIAFLAIMDWIKEH